MTFWGWLDIVTILRVLLVHGVSEVVRVRCQHVPCRSFAPGTTSTVNIRTSTEPRRRHWLTAVNSASLSCASGSPTAACEPTRPNTLPRSSTVADWRLPLGVVTPAAGARRQHDADWLPTFVTWFIGADVISCKLTEHDVIYERFL